MASSQLYAGEHVYTDDDDDDQPMLQYPGMGRGLRPPPPHEHSYEGVAEPFPSDLLIPRGEWQARIQELEERKENLSSRLLRATIPCKNQGQTSYCWINAPTHCMEIARMLQNQEYVSLSPSSAGGPIKGWRNQGGWGKEGLQWISNHGLCPSSVWPDNAYSAKNLYTEENKALALKYRTTEWMAGGEKNFDFIISTLLRLIPGAAGLNWWSHEVTYCDAVWLDGVACIRFRNSWGMSYGSSGFSILQGSKMKPDDYVAPRVAVAA